MIPLVLLRTPESLGVPAARSTCVGVVLSGPARWAWSGRWSAAPMPAGAAPRSRSPWPWAWSDWWPSSRWELRAPAPALPMRFFRTPALPPATPRPSCSTPALMGALFLVAQYLQVVFRYGPLGAGLRILPWTAVLFVSAPLSGILSRPAGPAAVAVDRVAHAVRRARLGRLRRLSGLGLRTWIGALFVAGAGVTMAMPAAQSAVLGSVPPAADRPGLGHLQHAAQPRCGVRRQPAVAGPAQPWWPFRRRLRAGVAGRPRRCPSSAR